MGEGKCSTSPLLPCQGSRGACREPPQASVAGMATIRLSDHRPTHLTHPPTLSIPNLASTSLPLQYSIDDSQFDRLCAPKLNHAATHAPVFVSFSRYTSNGFVSASPAWASCSCEGVCRRCVLPRRMEGLRKRKRSGDWGGKMRERSERGRFAPDPSHHRRHAARRSCYPC
jgi:hypothetical protein